MAQQDIEIPFPISGIDRSRSVRGSSPDTTSYAVNVHPRDAHEERMRGGSREGFQKRFTEQLEGVPQYMLPLSKVTSAFSEPYEFLFIGTSTSIYISSAVRNEAGGLVYYDEVLNQMNGAVQDQNSADILDENGAPIQSTSFAISDDANPYAGNVTAYQGDVIALRNTPPSWSGTATVTNGVITSGSITDWTTLGIDPAVAAINITGGTGVNVGSYNIVSITATEIIVTPSTTGTGTADLVAANGPVRIDPEDRTVGLVQCTGGTFPSSENAIITTYRDRLVWAVGSVWYMSRVGDAGDYNYAADVQDAGRAVAGTNSDAGLPGDPITGMVPVGYDFLVMFGEQTTWVLRGDPAFGGQLFNLSRKVGCVSPDAWCYGPDGSIFFLSKDGLYVVPSDLSQPPASISDQRMPEELKALDGENYDTALAYDIKNNAVVIFVTPRDGMTIGSHWWFDVTNQSFWEFQFADSDKQPIAACSYAGAPTRQRSVTVLNPDGYVREIGGSTDDGDPIASRIVVGPILMTASPAMDGLLSQLTTELAIDSNDVDIDIYVGDNGETVIDNASNGVTSPFSRKVSAGRFTAMRPRLRGVYAAISMSSSAYWANETLIATLVSTGRRRP